MKSYLKSISTGANCQLSRLLIQSNIQMKIVRRSWSMLLLIVVLACQNGSVSFKSFDSQRWISESLDCKNYRISVIDQMEAEFDRLLGMNEKELIRHLGKPEETHLYTRGQKFFNYSLTCGDSIISDKRLRIRFSALDQVNEVIVLD